MPRKALYWLIQIVVWSAYTMFLIFSFLTFTEVEYQQTMISIQVLFGGVMMFSSHAVRLSLKRLDAFRFKTFQLAGIAALICAAAALAGQVLIHIIIYLVFDWPGIRDFNLSESFVYWSNSLLILLIWTAVYIGIKSIERRQEKEVENWRLQAELREAELNILKAQINPHFLFNALNNIRSLITENPKKARDVLTNLSELLRYAVYHSSRDQVTLAEELRMVENYFELEKVQHEDRLRVEYDLDDHFEEVSLPPMTIQMLAENAIKHGISKRKMGGTVRIVVKGDAQGCQISVINDGTLSGKVRENGVGLQNIRERLRNLSGANSGPKLFEDRESGLVTATFTIPG
ncbi:MAG: hypothetical protein GVY02_06125 [Bacteroidetes bacterium]|jgi:anti-sigma regulatory factor (Ser/Thr protein kinase)|nr:hypothetical protein [Bacteroidota bacterium]